MQSRFVSVGVAATFIFFSARALAQEPPAKLPPKLDEKAAAPKAPQRRSLKPTSDEKNPPFAAWETPDIAPIEHKDDPKKRTYFVLKQPDGKPYAQPGYLILKFVNDPRNKNVPLPTPVPYGESEEGPVRQAIVDLTSGLIPKGLTLSNDTLYYNETPITLEFGSGTERIPAAEQTVQMAAFLAHAKQILLQPRRESLTTYDGNRLYFAVFQRPKNSPDIVAFPDERQELAAVEKIYNVLNNVDAPELMMKDSPRPTLGDSELFVFFYYEKNGKARWLGNTKESRTLNAVFLRQARQILVVERGIEADRAAAIVAAVKQLEDVRVTVKEAEKLLAEGTPLTAEVKKARIEAVTQAQEKLKEAVRALQKNRKDDSTIAPHLASITDLSKRASELLERLPYPAFVALPESCEKNFQLVQRGKARFDLHTKAEGQKTVVQFTKVSGADFKCAGTAFTVRGTLLQADEALPLPLALTQGVSTASTAKEVEKLASDQQEAVFAFVDGNLVLVLHALPQGSIANYDYAPLTAKRNGIRFTLRDKPTLTLETDVEGKTAAWRLTPPFTSEKYRFYQEDSGVRIDYVDGDVEKVLETVPGFDFRQAILLEDSLAFFSVTKGKPSQLKVYNGGKKTIEVSEQADQRFASIAAAGKGFVVRYENNVATTLEIPLGATKATTRFSLPASCDGLYTAVAGDDGIVTLSAKLEKSEQPLLRLKPRSIACAASSIALVTTQMTVEVKDEKPALKEALKDSNTTVASAAKASLEPLLIVLNGNSIVRLQRAPKGLTFSELSATGPDNQRVFALNVDVGTTRVPGQLALDGAWVTPQWIGGVDTRGQYGLIHSAATTYVTYDNSCIGTAIKLTASDSTDKALAFIADAFAVHGGGVKRLKNAGEFMATDSKRPQRLFVLTERSWIVEAESLDAQEPFAAVKWETLPQLGTVARVTPEFQRDVGGDYTVLVGLDAKVQPYAASGAAPTPRITLANEKSAPAPEK